MYLSKHKGGNAVSTADHFDPNEAKSGKRDVLEAYLGVTLKRLFSTGPEAFEEITSASRSSRNRSRPSKSEAASPPRPRCKAQALPQAVLDTVTVAGLRDRREDHYTKGHSQKSIAYAALIAEAMKCPTRKSRKSLAGCCTISERWHSGKHLEQERPV